MRISHCMAILGVALAADQLPEPFVFSGNVQVWNATYPRVEWCKDGMVAAMARSLSLEKLLGIEDIQPSSLLPTNHEEYMNATINNFLKSGSISEAEARQFAEANAIVVDTIVGGVGRNAQELFSALVANPFFVDKFRSLILGSESAKTSSSDEDDLVSKLEETMLVMTSQTFTNFLLNIVGLGTGKDAGILSGGSLFSPAGDGLRSPMINLLDSFCMASETGIIGDAILHKPLCAIVNLVSSILACAPDRPPTCKPDKILVWNQPTCSPQFGNLAGQQIDMKSYFPTFDFLDMRQNGKLPETLNMSVLDTEGLDSLLLYRSTTIGTVYNSRVFACGNLAPFEDPIPHWRLTNVFSYLPEGSVLQDGRKVRDTSLVLMMEPRLEEPYDDSDSDLHCKVVLSIRGTDGQFEWASDLDTVLVPQIKEGIKMHRGFVQLAHAVLPGIQMKLKSLFSDKGCTSNAQIILTGHSLGGGMASTLSLYLADMFPEAKIHSITFASPNVANAAGVDFVAENVNARNIVFDLDPIGASPCGSKYPHGFTRCNGVHQNGDGFDEYASLPGRITIPIMDEVGSDSHLNLNGTQWLKTVLHLTIVPPSKSLEVILEIPPPLQIGVSHVCAYSCKLSKYCTQDLDKAWDCKHCALKFPGFSTVIPM